MSQYATFDSRFKTKNSSGLMELRKSSLGQIIRPKSCTSEARWKAWRFLGHLRSETQGVATHITRNPTVERRELTKVSQQKTVYKTIILGKFLSWFVSLKNPQVCVCFLHHFLHFFISTNTKALNPWIRSATMAMAASSTSSSLGKKTLFWYQKKGKLKGLEFKKRFLGTKRFFKKHSTQIDANCCCFSSF